ncbi:MAG: hypothetical protein AB1591_01890 [Pseudomonadota bacterium]
MKTSLIAACLFAGLAANALAASGPSSSAPPYLEPRAPGVEFVAILSVGDAAQADGTYRMAGLPDGLGAYDNGDGSFTVLMNHELRRGSGAVRAHGAAGAFVSQWIIRKRDLMVLAGRDFVRTVKLWDGRGYATGASEGFSRFCSADLAPPSAFFNRASGKGLQGARLFLNGEEDSPGMSRGFAHVVGADEHGTAYELPKLGRHPFENLLANPFEQDKTLVAATEDGGDNKVYFYVGEKGTSGSSVERAGLNNGRTYQLKIEGYADDDPATGFRVGKFRLVEEGGTTLARPEDGAWDARNPDRFYFVTTAGFKGNSRLWEVRFYDIRRPERGGRIRVLLDGAKAGLRMLDNITVDGDGNVYMQEDVGNEPHLGRIWRFEPDAGRLTLLAQHDARFFLKGGADFLTEDEESSGIIEVSELFRGVEGYDTVRNRYFLLTVQAHYRLPGELVEGGQLLLMKVPR